MGSPPSAGPADYWSPGDWNIICSICGTKLKFSQAVQNWQGMWRHPKCNEPRHPQDFVHAINAQEMTIPHSQIMGEAYIQICTLETAQPMPGVGEPGCMLPGTGPPIELGGTCGPNGISGIPGLTMPGCEIPGGP